MRRLRGAAQAEVAAAVCIACAVPFLQAQGQAAEDALLLIKGEPPGAGVFIDGDAEPRGTTPCVVLVAPGPHTVRLELGDLCASAEAVAVAGAPVTVELKLTAAEKRPEAPAATPPDLAQFDSLVEKGDYTGARRDIERARGGDAAVVRAALRVVDSLDARKRAIRTAARSLAGNEAELRTTRGKLSGEVADVTDEGVVLVVKKKLRGMGTIETRIKVKWSDLAPEEEDALARTGGWRAAGADGEIARAYLALARKDVRAAERALLRAGGAAGDHPLAAHVRRRIEAPRREAAERAARVAWEEIEKAAGRAKTSADAVRGLIARIETFGRTHGDTEFAASVTQKAAAMRRRARLSLLPARGLVGYWKLDESAGGIARDSSGSRHDGTLHGNPVWRSQGGRLDGALEFDGSGQYVDCGTAPGSAEALTVAFWMKAGKLGFMDPVDKNPDGATGVGWTVKLRGDGTLLFQIGSKSNHSVLAASRGYTAGVWIHVACTFRSGNARVYMNGTEKGAKTGVRQPVNNTATRLYIGRPSVAATQERFAGLLDDVRIYDRALSAAEIAVLYRADAPAGRTAEPGPPETAPEPPPVDVKRRSTGLLGTYFSGRNHDRPVIRRIDQQVDFDWGKRPPDPRMPADDFSVRWEGFVLAPVTGRYVFHVDSDDGTRMWLSGKSIFDKWGLRRVVKEQSSAVSLAKGRFYPVRIEHMDAGGLASVHLRWTGPGTREPVPVPGDFLRPPPGYEKLPGPPFAEVPSPPP